MCRLQNTMNSFPHLQIFMKTNASGSVNCKVKGKVLVVYDCNLYKMTQKLISYTLQEDGHNIQNIVQEIDYIERNFTNNHPFLKLPLPHYYKWTLSLIKMFPKSNDLNILLLTILNNFLVHLSSKNRGWHLVWTNQTLYGWKNP